jgi:hypothetical protein
MRSSPPTKAQAAGWQRVDRNPGKLGARWRHVSGWTLSHCGHPTANFPWDLRDPQGKRVLSGVLYSGNPEHGYAWRTLAKAFGWVATQLRGTR